MAAMRPQTGKSHNPLNRHGFVRDPGRHQSVDHVPQRVIADAQRDRGDEAAAPQQRDLSEVQREVAGEPRRRQPSILSDLAQILGRGLDEREQAADRPIGDPFIARETLGDQPIERRSSTK